MFDNISERIHLTANSTTSNNVGQHSVDMLDPAYAQFRDLTRFWVQRVAVPLIMVIGLFGNLITIIIMTRRRMRSTTNMYLAALAFVDMLYLVLTFLLGLSHYPNMAERKYYLYWRLRPFLMMLTDACSNTSVWLTVTFTIERFIAVKYPMKGKVWCTEARAKKLIAFVFAFSTLFALPVPFEWEVVEKRSAILNQNNNNNNNNKTVTTLTLGNTEFGRADAYKTIYYRLNALIFAFLPLFSVTLFNAFLIHSVHQSKKERNRMTNQQQQQSPQVTSHSIVAVPQGHHYQCTTVDNKLASIYRFNNNSSNFITTSKDQSLFEQNDRSKQNHDNCDKISNRTILAKMKQRLRNSSLLGNCGNNQNFKMSNRDDMSNHRRSSNSNNNHQHQANLIKICVKLHEASNGKSNNCEGGSRHNCGQQDCSDLFVVVKRTEKDCDKNVGQFIKIREAPAQLVAHTVGARTPFMKMESGENEVVVPTPPLALAAVAAAVGNEFDNALSLPNQNSFETCEKKIAPAIMESIDNTTTCANSNNNDCDSRSVAALKSSTPEISSEASTNKNQRSLSLTLKKNAYNGNYSGVGNNNNSLFQQCGNNSSVSMASQAGITSCNAPVVIAASSQERRITIMLIAVVLLFLVCQMPSAAMLLYTAVRETEPNTNEDALILGLGNIFNYLMAINAACNFILYSFLSEKYRKTFVILFCGCFNSDSTTTTNNCNNNKLFNGKQSHQSFKCTNQYPHSGRSFASRPSTTFSKTIINSNNSNIKNSGSGTKRTRGTNNVRFDSTNIQSQDSRKAKDSIEQSSVEHQEKEPCCDTLL